MGKLVLIAKSSKNVFYDKNKCKIKVRVKVKVKVKVKNKKN